MERVSLKIKSMFSSENFTLNFEEINFDDQADLFLLDPI